MKQKKRGLCVWPVRRRGMSLVELVISIIIIAILAAAVFTGGSSTIRKAQTSRVTSDFHNFEIAMTSFMNSNRAAVKLNIASPKADFDAIVDGLNRFLGQDYKFLPNTTPEATGNIHTTVSGLIAYRSDKTDAWDNHYYLLIDAASRNEGMTEYYMTVVTAGPNAQADIGGPLDKDDIFLLCQYSNGQVTTKTYNMKTDTKDGAGFELKPNLSTLSSRMGTSHPRNVSGTGSGGGGEYPGGGTGGGTGGGGGGSGHTHSWSEGSSTPATCTDPGTKELVCSCGAKKEEAIPALGHDWAAWTFDDTIHSRTCKRDPEHKEEGTHTWDAGVVTKQPTAVAPGVKTFTCTAECGATKTEEVPPGTPIEATTFLSISASSAFSISASKGWDGTMEYSTDKMAWHPWTGSTISSDAAGSGQYIFLRGTGNTVISGGSSWTISGSDVKVQGSIESLLDYTKVEAGNHPTMADNAFASLFAGNHSIVTAPALTATTLSKGCYQNMFKGCINLTGVPELPATSLKDNCYNGMFNGCAKVMVSAEQNPDYFQSFHIGGPGASNALTDMFAGTGGTFTSTPDADTTYYLSINNSLVS